MRLTKWAIELGNYEFEVIYRVGRENLEADALSRAPIDQVYCDREYQKGINMLTKTEIEDFQKASGVEGEKREDIVVRKESDGRVRVIVRGEAMENELFERYHNEYNHRGVDTMLNLIRKSWAVKDLRKKLENFTKRCETCIKNKAAMKQSIGFLSRMGPAIRPFQIVSIDTKGGFSGYKSAKKYLHMAIDHMTRFVWTTTAKGQGENDLINLVNEILKSGKPEVILCDRYGAMRGNKFKEYLKGLGIKLVYICADSAPSNGTIERVGFTLSDGIRCKLYERDYSCAWTTIAKEVVNIYNDTPHSVTGFAPRFLLTGERREFEIFANESEISMERARELAIERSTDHMREMHSIITEGEKTLS